MFVVSQMMMPDDSGEIAVFQRTVPELHLSTMVQVMFWGEVATRINISLTERIIVRETPDELGKIWCCIPLQE